MLIAERFLLLALDPIVGTVRTPHRGTDVAALCAGGLLLELVMQRRLHVNSQRLVQDSSLPLSHPVLEHASEVLAGLPHATVAEAIVQLERRLSPLPQVLLDGLARRDLLHRIRDWKFWSADSTRYPVRSLQARNEAIAMLQRASEPNDEDDFPGMALLLLADVSGVMSLLLDAVHHERATAALLALNSSSRTHSESFALAAVRDTLLA